MQARRALARNWDDYATLSTKRQNAAQSAEHWTLRMIRDLLTLQIPCEYDDIFIITVTPP